MNKVKIWMKKKDKKKYFKEEKFLLSARFQLENWSSQAWLGSEPFQLGSAWVGKFQLELIIKLISHPV